MCALGSPPVTPDAPNGLTCHAVKHELLQELDRRLCTPSHGRVAVPGIVARACLPAILAGLGRHVAAWKLTVVWLRFPTRDPRIAHSQSQTGSAGEYPRPALVDRRYPTLIIAVSATSLLERNSRARSAPNSGRKT